MNGTLAQAERGTHHGRLIGRVLARLYRVRVEGADRVPASGPVVLVSNHSSAADGPLLFTVTPRPVHFLIKVEMFTGPLRPFLHHLAQIPVDRSRGDRAALTSALDVLRQGGVVGIFPEGTRGQGDVAQVQQGAAWLALQSGAEVVPVALVGTLPTRRNRLDLPRPGSRLRAVYGEPFRVSVTDAEGRTVPGRERLRLASAQVRDHLAAHVVRARSEV
ncbi:1-acyl-sn-glycerol-3-phosphate acyltransferase [Arsenicicoccus piscis]|uniref:1-acyl-sn-glycerol-3-phosphate acyltransferase n=1 Tax=Arsenicicoccus piscis TaxID=673954 RepID=A0ABQ6HPS9_9MICO|nr:lysophospholipid acyltransferase family protein [Arsenicicoccus piscis]MCH8628963.1 1-acyl-sn-glycerol-3-phosphate acyltransferase [Arsenicicoccus piscis]GMA19575.1 1-acyl-sn-glycerol-3-phosphate acyltransferase [Arsenicicoccus piscis]